MPRHLCDPSPPAQPLLRKPDIPVRMQEHHSKHGVLYRKAPTTAATSYLLQELALAALTQTTWAVDATSRLVLTKAFGGSCKSRAPGTCANLSTSRLWAAAAAQGVVIWGSEPCLRCRMLLRCFCSLVFISPVQSRQAGSSQHSNFQLTLTWVSTTIPCAREPEKHHNLQPTASYQGTNIILPQLHLIIWFSRDSLWGYATLCLWDNSMALFCFLCVVLLQPWVARSL